MRKIAILVIMVFLLSIIANDYAFGKNTSFYVYDRLNRSVTAE